MELMSKHWLEDETDYFTKDEEIRIRAAINDSEEAVFKYDNWDDE